MRRRNWRISERARPVRTKLSQFGLGRADWEVMISTTSPFSSSARSSAGSWLILAATARLPTSVWIE